MSDYITANITLFANRVSIRPVFPGTVPFFIQMSRVNIKSPAFPKYPSVFSQMKKK
jgi:hypothetical protein